MSFLGNLFGVISEQAFPYSNDVDFIPTGFGGKTVDIKGDNISWLGMKSRIMQKHAYDFCHPVGAVADRLAEYDLTLQFQVLRHKGKGKEDFATSTFANNLNARFEQPNPLQSYEQFRGQQNVWKRVFGFCPVYPLVPTGFTKDNCVAMFNIPPWLFTVKANKIKTGSQDFFSSTLSDIVEYYEFQVFGKTVKFKPEELIILEDSYMMDSNADYLLPQSKLVGLDMAISNVCAAMEADNVLLRKRGPLGFISQDPGAKDSVIGYEPLDKDDKQELQNDLAQYGLSWRQWQMVVSRFSVRWNPTSFNTAELGTKESVVQGSKAIWQRFGVPYILYEQSEATYANGASAATGVYFNTVIPNANKDAGRYNAFFKCTENNAKIVFDPSKVPFLQDDMKSMEEGYKVQNDRLLQEYDNDLITKNQWRMERGYDSVPGEDEFKSVLDKAKAIAPLDNTLLPIKKLEDETIAPEAERPTE